MVGPSMFTPEGNQAVIDAVAEIEAMVEVDRRIRNKATLTKAVSPILRAVAETHPEITDTEPRCWIANKLDAICEENGWSYNEWEGYDWYYD